MRTKFDGTHTILIVEDQMSMIRLYQKTFLEQSFNLVYVRTGTEALDYLQQHTPSIILLDLGLPDISGVEVLKNVQQRQLSSIVIVVTWQEEIAGVVEIIRLGAFDYLEKPLKIERLQLTLRNALHQYELQSYIDHTQTFPTRESYYNLVGVSPAMQLVYQMIDSVAKSKIDVLITGESGTGKELCAEAIHRTSDRAAQPFIIVNCAAIPENLFESQLFGHVKGAFTGAINHRKGAAAQADGGTLLLDEIGELSLPLQSTLLRFVQTKTFHRLGSDTLETVDVRIICATNRHLLAEVGAGKFREDLYYRLDIVHIKLPPLRERGQDCIKLAKLFLHRFNQQEQKAFKGFSPEAEALLLKYSWQGNVRQLQNMIHNIVVLNQGAQVTAEMLQMRMNETQLSNSPVVFAEVTEISPTPTVTLVNNGQFRTFEEIRKETILAAIQHCQGNISEAAKVLGLGKTTLYRDLQQWEDD